MFSRRSFLSAIGLSTITPWTPASAVEPTAEYLSTSLPNIGELPEEVQFILNGCADILQSVVFEPNDATTRTKVAFACRSLIGEASARRQIYTGSAICDDRNNTAQTIDDHSIVLDLNIYPLKRVEFYSFEMTLGPKGLGLRNLAETYS